MVLIVIFTAKGLVNKTAKLDYYEIGADKIPTVKLAIGEERKVVGVSNSISGKVTTKEIKYEVSGSKQGEEMLDYYLYLHDDGFLTLTDIDFSGSRGTGVFGRNSVDDGYEIQLQIEYNREGYTITIMKQPGGITPYDTDDAPSGSADRNSADDDDSISSSFSTDSGNTPGSTDNSGNSGSGGTDSGNTPGSTDNSGNTTNNSGNTTDNSGITTDNSGNTPGSGVDNNGNNTVGDGSLTKDIFAIIDSGEYHMAVNISTSASDEDMDFSFDMDYDLYAKDGMMAMVIDFFGTMRMVYRDGKVYTIYDDFEYMSVSDSATGDDIDDLDIMTRSNLLTYIGENSGEFSGSTYRYDEYTSSDGTVFHYFVDGGMLKGIRTIDPYGNITDTKVITFENYAPDSVFEIPTDFEME